MSLKLNERYPARFNNPTAGYPQGSFKNRTTPTAKDGSYLEKDWANDKEGFFQSLLSAAGIMANGAVDAVGASQFFDALQALKQIQAGTAFTTAGSAGALTLTPTPAISAYSAPQRFRVKFSQASTGSDTINVSGVGAKNIKQYSPSGSKVSAAFASGQLSDIEYDGTDFVLIDQLPTDISGKANIDSQMFTGTPALNLTAPIHDNTARLANTNFVQQELTNQQQSTETAPGIIYLATAAEVTAGANATKSITPATLATKISAALNLTAGYNRSPVDVTASRSSGTSYTNNVGAPILVIVSLNTLGTVDTTTVTVGAVVVYSGDLGVSSQQVPVTFLVPNGATYSVTCSGSTIQRWVEIR